MGSKISLVMLLLGAALLWLLPVGGALLLVMAAVGLAICWEAELEPPAVVAPVTLPVVPARADDLAFPSD
jgi:hypothetical protein